MEARVIHLGEAIAPFGQTAAELPILGQPLASLQRQQLDDLKIGLGDENSQTPVLLISDHVWFTSELLRAFLDRCPPSGGQLVIDGPLLAFSRPLQDFPNAETVRLPIAIVPHWPFSVEDLAALPPVQVALDIDLHENPPKHPVFAHATQPIPLSDKLVHTISHWTHLHRVNLMALAAQAIAEHRRFKRASWLSQAWSVLKLLVKARSFNKWRIASVIAPRGKNCVIHPTAVVEASVLGDHVEIGAYAVVRGSWIGDHVSIGDHARVNLSVLNERAQAGPNLTLNLCLLLEEAFVSVGNGIQSCVFGRQSFTAIGATFFDLSFGQAVRVLHRGERVSAHTYFLGSCLGHRVKIGPNVTINYGEAIPNDAFIIMDPGQIVRRVPVDLPSEPLFFRDGQLVSARAKKTNTSPILEDGDE